MTSKTFAISRAVGVIGATAVLATGVTFAALTSNVATLTDTTVNSATASLKLWDGNSYETTAPGFTITGLVPGEGSGVKPLYMSNDGQVDLKLAAHVTVAPSATGFTGWQNLKITIKDDNSGATKETNMDELLTGNVELPTVLAAGATGDSGVVNKAGNYSVTFDITPESVNGSSVSVGAFTIDFSGTQPAVD